MDIKKQIDGIFDETVAVRRDFHLNPELSEKESKTAQKVSEYLTRWGIKHETGIAGNGVVAMIEGKSPVLKNQTFKVIGIRADIDALPIQEAVRIPFCSQNPGVMHACGHDIHTAVLLGSAKILKQREKELNGTVKFFFQPAEETIGGARRMIEAGCMENPKVDVVMGLHVAPNIPVGTVGFRRGKMNASSSEFNISVQGITCHGAYPNNGVDTVLVAAHIVCALQSIVSRNVSPTNPAVVTVGQFHGGNKNNIISKEVVMSGIIRCLDLETREFLKEKVRLVVENTAEAFGAKAEVKIHDSYPVLINDDEIETIFEKLATQYFSEKNILLLNEPSLGADDFSYFAQVAKSIYFNIGTLAKGETVAQKLHSEYFNPDEQSIKAGILMEVAGVLELFNKRSNRNL
jgi:amidohydrolase